MLHKQTHYMTTKKSILFGLSLSLLSITGFAQTDLEISPTSTPQKNLFDLKKEMLSTEPSYFYLTEPVLNTNLALQVDEPFFKNRRNLYSSLWAFASLNYLYADLVGLMDKNKLVQYQSGEVDGLSITPEFLTVAAVFMQIPIANVFLPHLIKNEKTLRWVQIISGSVMTLVQTSTLFVGKPTPYYTIFSTFEVVATTYITVDAIKWKPKTQKKGKLL